MKKGFTPLEIQENLSSFKNFKAKPPNGLVSFSTKSSSKFLTGFTLVEILVAVTIFVIVITVVSSLFVQAIRGQRRNLAYQELLDQASYVMEYMSRSIRMAMKDMDGTCTGTLKLNYATSTFGGVVSCLQFRNYKDECQSFCLDEVNKKLMVSTSTPPLLDPTDLTSPELEVYPLGGVGTEWIELSGETQNDNLQPLVTILLRIEGREGAEIEIRNSVSQRNLDVTK